MTTGYILLDTPNTRQPQGVYPRRGGHRPSGTAIVHTTEGNWRSGVGGLTDLVRSRGDWGCYHRACDWADVALYYPWEWETWQDTETNNWAVGVAAACKTTDWGTMPADVEEGYYRNLARMGADFVVYMRDTYGVEVPRRRISGAEARARVPGFCAHGDSGVARSDPGARFDWARFFRYINEALDGTEEDVMNADQEKLLREVRDRVFGRDVQRYYHPDTLEVRTAPFEGAVEARSTDVHDTISTNNLITAQTNRILDAVATLPGIDPALIEGLRDQLSAELHEATRNVSVTLTARTEGKDNG